MSDNQIVTNIVSSKTGFPAQIGERFILRDSKCEIIEYDGKQMITIPQTSVPKYIFVSEILTTVILFNDKIWNFKKWFICSTCEKLTMNKIKCTYNMKELCIHCFYKINYDNPNRTEYDGNPMTIGKYIKKYSRCHRMDRCSDPKRCFLCDFNNGKFMSDINDRDIIYGKHLNEILKNKTIDITI